MSRARWILLLATALLLRLGTAGLAYARDADAILSPDAHAYIALARNMLHEGRFALAPGEPLQTRRTPGFPLLVAAVFATVGDDPRAVVVLGVLSSTLTVALAAVAGQAIGGPLVAFATGMLLAVDSASILGCHRVLTEPLFTALVVGAITVAARAAERGGPGPRDALGLGALLAVAALTRPIGLVLGIPFGVWVLVAPRRRGFGGGGVPFATEPPWDQRRVHPGAGTRQGLGGGGVLLIAFALPWALLVGGWLLRNGLATGGYTPSDSLGRLLLLGRGADIIMQRDGISHAMAREQLRQGVETAEVPAGQRRESLYLERGFLLVRAHPVLFLWTQVRFLHRLALDTGADTLAWRLRLRRLPGAALAAAALAHVLLLYAGLGLALAGTRHRRASRAGVLALAGLLLVFVAVSTTPATYWRFRVPFAPILCLLAAVGLAGLHETGRTRR